MTRFLCAAFLVASMAVVSLQAREPRSRRADTPKNKIQIPNSVKDKLQMAALPDLTIASMARMPGGDLRVFVRNAGQKASTPCKLGVTLTAANGGPLGQTSQNLGAIQPGLTMLVTIPLGSLPGGTYVTAKADGANSMAESNENNNSRTIVLPNLSF